MSALSDGPTASAGGHGARPPGGGNGVTTIEPSSHRAIEAIKNRYKGKKENVLP